MSNGCPGNNFCYNSVSVLIGNGNGTFQDPVTYDTPAVVGGLVIADVNRDGKLDLVTMNHVNTQECDCIGVLFGNGDGTFQEPAIITELAGYPEAIAAGHFSSNKNLDLAVTLSGISSDVVQILLGNGDGTFRLGESYQLGPASQSIVAADFRKNGMTDLAIGEFEGAGIAVLLGNGDGTFEQPVVYPSQFPNGIAAADLNGDGVPDVVTASDTSFDLGDVAVYLGNGDGTFQSAVLYSAGSFPDAVGVADFNGDHMPDIIAIDEFNNNSFLLLNTGAVSFSPTTPLSFPRQLVGTTSAPRSATLTNNGTSPLTISSITLGGKAFHMETTCSQSVPPGGSCSVSATFSPQAQGNSDGVINIKSSASSKPMAVDLIGSGTVVEFLPAALTFASQKVGTTSVPQYVRVTNTGSTTLQFNDQRSVAIYVGGPDYNDFPEKNNCGTSLAAGASCTVKVTFTPKKTGTRSAVIYFNDTGGATPQIVLLTGTGS